MDYNAVITRVEQNMKERQLSINTDISKGITPFEIVGILRNAAKYCNKSVIILETDSEKLEIITDKEINFFEDYINRTVFISGVLNTAGEEPCLYISCFFSTVKDELKDINISETEKKKLRAKLDSLNSNIRKDLISKMKSVEKNCTKVKADKSDNVFYITDDEQSALYSVVKNYMPTEWRKEYERCSMRLKLDILSNAERNNYKVIMKSILEHKWTEDYFHPIDIEKLEKVLFERHIGHRHQIEKIINQMRIGNDAEKPYRTINISGYNSGKSSFTYMLASETDKNYEIIDLSGNPGGESIERLIGSSKIYDNGMEGSLFNSIQKVGLYGTLVFINVDRYTPDVLNAIEPIICKGIYEDKFIEIPMDMSNMKVIITSDNPEKLPAVIKDACTEYNFEKLTMDEQKRLVNDIFIPDLCREYGIKNYRKVSDEALEYLIFNISHCINSSIRTAVESFVIDAAKDKPKTLPDITEESLKLRLGPFDYSYLEGRKATSIIDLENRFYNGVYPECIKTKVTDIFVKLKGKSIDGEDRNYYLECLKTLVNIEGKEPDDLSKGKVLEYLISTHYGLDAIGKKIENILDAEKKRNRKRLNVICFYGPPGTGKTTLCESIAKAVDRNYIKVNFGSISGDSFINGTARTIKNAGPGYVLDELSNKGGSYSSVMIINELDKGNELSYKTLYDFFDPTEEFVYNKYLETNIPKEKFIILVTANDLSKVPAPIIDRMELIKVDGYSLNEQKVIAKEYIFKKYIDQMNLKNTEITDGAINAIVNNYIYDRGIRTLDRCISNILSEKVNECGNINKLTITEKDVLDILGPPVNINDLGNPEPVPGQVMGMCVSGSCGMIVAIQAVINEYQTDKIVFPANSDDSMKESIIYAVSLAEKSLHAEIPKIAISLRGGTGVKGGSSAGMAIYMAIMSSVLNVNVEGAFTGAIDLYGNISMVAVKDKLDAAVRTGISNVYIPKANYDIIEAEGNLKQYYPVNIIPISNVSELDREFFREVTR